MTIASGWDGGATPAATPSTQKSIVKAVQDLSLPDCRRPGKKSCRQGLPADAEGPRSSIEARDLGEESNPPSYCTDWLSSTVQDRSNVPDQDIARPAATTPR